MVIKTFFYSVHKGEGKKYQDKGEEWDKGKEEEDKYQDKGEEDKYQDKGEEWDKGEELECVVALREEPELG